MDTLKKYIIIPCKGFLAIICIQAFFLLVVMAMQAYTKTNLLENRDLQKKEIQKLNSLINQNRANIAALKNVRNTFENTPNSSIQLMSSTIQDTNLIFTPEYQLQCELIARPIFNQSLSVIAAYGISNEEIMKDWGDAYDEELVIKLALSIVVYEGLDNEHSLSQIRKAFFLIGTVHAERLYDCAMRALGIEALYELWRTRALSTYAGKKALVKAIGKVATRSLGWVGAAWAVGDFIDFYY